MSEAELVGESPLEGGGSTATNGAAQAAIAPLVAISNEMVRIYQYADTSRFTEPVERITGRRVIGFVSGIDAVADIACELFILEPEDRAADR
jgi:hypothetical protein